MAEISVRTDIRAVLLRANGHCFSVGGDVAMFADDIDDAPATVLGPRVLMPGVIKR